MDALFNSSARFIFLKLFLFIFFPSIISACGGDDGDSSNDFPTVNAGADLSVGEREVVTLSAVANDSDGSVSSITWVQASGASVSLSGNTTSELVFTAPEVDDASVLSFTVTATDNSGASVTDTVSVTVIPNRAPTVDAGLDQEVDEQTLAVIEVSANDDDGAIDSYAWEQISGTAVDIVNVASPVLRFTAPAVSANEEINFSVTVTDDDGDQATDNVSVLVVANLPPSISAGADRDRDEKSEVILEAVATDVDGEIISIEWTQVSGRVVELMNANTLAASFMAPDVSDEETLQFQSMAIDNDGDQGVDLVDIVIVPNVAPLVIIPEDLESTEQSEFMVTVESSDEDGTVESFLWEQVSGTTVALSGSTTDTLSFIVPNISEEEQLEFQLTVTDDDGDTTVNDVVVTVVPLSYAINVFDLSLRCTQETADDVTVTFYDAEGVAEEFPLEYVGPEQTFNLQPSGELPLSIRVQSGISQYIGVNTRPTGVFNFGISPLSDGCACSTYTITLNERVESARLSRGGTAILGVDSMSWEDIELCENDLDLVHILDQENGRGARVVFDGSSNVTVPSLQDMPSTLLDGDAPEAVFTPGGASFDIDAFVTRSEVGMLEQASTYYDTDLTDMTAQYLGSDIITDYRVDFVFTPEDASVTVSDVPDIYTGVISSPSIREVHSALLPVEDLSEGFSYNAFQFDEVSVDFQSERVVIDTVGASGFDAAVMLSGFDGALTYFILPMENGIVDLNLLENIGITPLSGLLFILPVDYEGSSSYDDAVLSFFRQHQSGFDLRFRYLRIL